LGGWIEVERPRRVDQRRGKFLLCRGRRRAPLISVPHSTPISGSWARVFL